MGKINRNINIFIKYNEETGIPNKSTMEEHIKVYNKKNKMAWGHFTNTNAKRNKKGLWSERTKYIDEQLERRIETFVFFYCRTAQTLYVANLINYYDREEPDHNDKLVELIPEYYHDRIGSINIKKDINIMRSYAFVEVNKLRKIDFKDTEYIYNFKGEKEEIGNEKVLDSKGMSSLLYVNLDEEFYYNLINENKFFVEDDNHKNIGYVNKVNDNENIYLNNEINSIDREVVVEGRKYLIETNIKNKELGDLGELLVFNLEKKRVFKELGEEYVSKVQHISQIDDTKGYDILSLEKNDEGEIVEKYIEVKTTEGNINTQFYISAGELKFSKNNREQYYLYRVYNYNKETGDANIIIKKGNIEEKSVLTPKSYIAYLK